MRRQSIILTIALLIIAPAIAAAGEPVLTSDPQVGVTRYRVRLGANAEWTEAEASAAGAAWFPLASWPRGTYPACEIQAGGNVSITDTVSGVKTEGWQWSASAPFVYAKMAGATPTGVKMVTGP